MIHEQFANQMRVCADGTANLHCTICEQFTYHLPRTKICYFFGANTKKTGCARCPFHAPGVLCSPQVRGKLINRAPNAHHTRMTQHVSGTLVYTKFYTSKPTLRDTTVLLSSDWSKITFIFHNWSVRVVKEYVKCVLFNYKWCSYFDIISILSICVGISKYR